MGIFDFLTKPVRDLYIARPQSAMDDIVFRHPDQSLPRGAKVTVRDDEQALFFREGTLFGVLGAGVHRLESSHLRFLGDLLVSPLTGDRHFITELFFVRTSEQLVTVGPLTLGMHKDLGSGHLVGFQARCKINVRVVEPASLVLEIGGVRADAGARIEEVIRERFTSILSAAVGELSGLAPATDLASNRYSEEIGQRVMSGAEQSLTGTGLRLTRFLGLQLSLDAESERALRSYGAAQAQLNLERQGAEVATNPGFGAYHAAHGQRALLEGAGKGMSSSQGVSSVLSLGMGSPFMGAMSGGAVAAPARYTSPAPRLATGEVARFELRSPRGTEGPFVARQLGLRLRLLEADLHASYVRKVGESGWTPAAEHPVAISELRQLPQASARSGAPADATTRFDQALEMAAADGQLSVEEWSLLARIAEQSGLAEPGEAARAYVLTRARALGLKLP